MRREKETEKSESIDWGFFSGIFTAIGYSFAAVALGFVVWVMVRAVMKLAEVPHLLSAREATVTTVAGLDVRPESLPDDPVRVAQDLWRAGRFRDALSLLYRAALAWQIHEKAVPIVSSDTEGDCVLRVSQMPEAGELHRGFFAHLTGLWQGLAYGSVQPTDESWGALCAQWPFTLGRGGRAGQSTPANS